MVQAALNGGGGSLCSRTSGQACKGGHLGRVCWRWVLLERTKCLFEETLHPSHRAILSPQVSPIQGLS